MLESLPGVEADRVCQIEADAQIFRADTRGRFPASAERRSSWLFPFAT